MHRLAFRPLFRSARALRARTPALHPLPTRSARLASSTTYSGREPPVQPPASSTEKAQQPQATPSQSKPRITPKASLDPAGVYTPAEYVDAQLQTPEVQAVVKNLSTEDYDIYITLSSRISKENGHSDPLAVNDLGVFLEQHGVDLDLPAVLFEPREDRVYIEHTQHPQLAEISYTDPTTQQVQTVRSLMDPVPHFDARDVFDIPASHHNPYPSRVTTRNHVSIFNSLPSPPPSSPSPSTQTTGKTSRTTSLSLPIPMTMIKDLYQSILIARTVKQQTSKGKIMRKYFLVCVGNGKGLVGYGEAKDFNSRLALQKARFEALKNMDAVSLFEQRTVWTEMSGKLGATRLIIRPRPVGFGLRCNPFLHQVLRAAGFKDISAKVWGSRNKLNVIKCAFNMIQGGHAPVGMGDGIGGKGKRLSRGMGMIGKEEMERARGRKLISLRK
ncbi:putative 37S ribosomal protein S5, mitochondrial [Leucoagaricus sp. SymC.cos]|nr:putative 37S ribosomal protein S5, mitochondrial [Leucoagaricus sp. SymC.cos]